METGIGSITDALVNSLINEFNKPEIKNKINATILSPVMKNVRDKFIPYFSSFMTLLAIIIILNVIIILLLIKKNN
jgi:hypothetical protein